MTTTLTTDRSSRPLAKQQPAAAPQRRAVAPAVDVLEREDRVLLIADVPGVAQDGVELTVDRGVLTLRARSQQTAPEGFTAIWREYEPVDYERQFTLGDGIDPDGISATVINGVLTIELLKAKAAQPRKIAVKAG